MHRTWKRANSVSMNTNFLALDIEFNEIEAVVNAAAGNLQEKPRDDAIGVDETKYSVSVF